MKLISESTVCLLAIFARLQGVRFQRRLRFLEGAQTEKEAPLKKSWPVALRLLLYWHGVPE